MPQYRIQRQGQQCGRCYGCGLIANSDDEEPWSVWAGIAAESAQAVYAGIVRHKPCPKCKATGVNYPKSNFLATQYSVFEVVSLAAYEGEDWQKNTLRLTLINKAIAGVDRSFTAGLPQEPALLIVADHPTSKGTFWVQFLERYGISALPPSGARFGYPERTGDHREPDYPIEVHVTMAGAVPEEAKQFEYQMDVLGLVEAAKQGIPTGDQLRGIFQSNGRAGRGTSD